MTSALGVVLPTASNISPTLGAKAFPTFGGQTSGAFPPSTYTSPTTSPRPAGFIRVAATNPSVDSTAVDHLVATCNTALGTAANNVAAHSNSHNSSTYASHVLSPTSGGVGGSYFVSNPDSGEIVAVYKPRAEEPGGRPHSLMSPRPSVTMTGLPGFVPGELYLREAAAYIVDSANGHAARVPPTTAVSANFSSPASGSSAAAAAAAAANTGGSGSHSSGSNYSSPRFSSPRLSSPASDGLGSLQAYVAGTIGSSEDFGAAVLNSDHIVQIALFDLRTGNCDRHAGNMLVSGTTAPYAVTPIDHGYCFPTQLGGGFFEWQFWPVAAQPLSPEVVSAVAKLDGEADAARIAAALPGLPRSALLVFRIHSAALKVCVAAGMTLREIATLFTGSGAGSLEACAVAAAAATFGSASSGVGAGAGAESLSDCFDACFYTSYPPALVNCFVADLVSRLGAAIGANSAATSALAAHIASGSSSSVGLETAVAADGSTHASPPVSPFFNLGLTDDHNSLGVFGGGPSGAKAAVSSSGHGRLGHGGGSGGHGSIAPRSTFAFTSSPASSKDTANQSDHIGAVESTAAGPTVVVPSDAGECEPSGTGTPTTTKGVYGSRGDGAHWRSPLTPPATPTPSPQQASRFSPHLSAGWLPGARLGSGAGFGGVFSSGFGGFSDGRRVSSGAGSGSAGVGGGGGGVGSLRTRYGRQLPPSPPQSPSFPAVVIIDNSVDENSADSSNADGSNSVDGDGDSNTNANSSSGSVPPNSTAVFFTCGGFTSGGGSHSSANSGGSSSVGSCGLMSGAVYGRGFSGPGVGGGSGSSYSAAAVAAAVAAAAALSGASSTSPTASILRVEQEGTVSDTGSSVDASNVDGGSSVGGNGGGGGEGDGDAGTSDNAIRSVGSAEWLCEDAPPPPDDPCLEWRKSPTLVAMFPAVGLSIALSPTPPACSSSVDDAASSSAVPTPPPTDRTDAAATTLDRAATAPLTPTRNHGDGGDRELREHSPTLLSSLLSPRFGELKWRLEHSGLANNSPASTTATTATTGHCSSSNGISDDSQGDSHLPTRSVAKSLRDLQVHYDQIQRHPSSPAYSAQYRPEASHTFETRLNYSQRQRTSVWHAEARRRLQAAMDEREGLVRNSSSASASGAGGGGSSGSGISRSQSMFERLDSSGSSFESD